MNFKSGLLTLLLAGAMAGAQDKQVLQDFNAADLNGAYKTNGMAAQVVDDQGGKAIKVTAGTDNPYPNIVFNPPGGNWDLSKYKTVDLDVTNLIDESIRIGLKVDNVGATGRKNTNNGGITLDPGEKGTVTVELIRDVSGGLSEKHKGMHRTPWGPHHHQARRQMVSGRS